MTTKSEVLLTGVQCWLIAVTDLKESERNPRKHFDKGKFADLVASVKVKGILEPLLVREMADQSGKYEILGGTRRFRAATEAGLKSAPCIIRDLNDVDALEVMIIDNLQRDDIHPIDEADSYKQLLSVGKYDVAALAAQVGKSEGYIYQRMKLTELIAPLKKFSFDGKLSLSTALLLSRLQPAQQKEAIKWVQRGDSARGIAEEIDRHFHLQLTRAAFPTNDETLVEAAGSCTACPKRTGANPLLFPDIKQTDICTDPDCFEQKERAFVKIQVGTHPDAVLLSAGYFGYQAKTKGMNPDQWKRVGGATCDHTAEGVIVELSDNFGGRNRDEYKLGQVFRVCTNFAKCKIHNQEVSSRGTRAPMSPSEKKARLAKEITNETQRRTITAVLEKVQTITPLAIDIIARSMFNRIWHDHKKTFFQRHAWEPLKSKNHSGKDYETPFQAEYEKLSQQDKARVVVELAILQDSAPDFGSSACSLSEAVKSFKVDTKAIEREVRKERTEKSNKK